MKISLSMIVKASDSEAKLLDRCLKSCHEYFDELNITITGNNDACLKVCKKYKAKVSKFHWCNDFAAARNFNFHQANGDYIMWLDADDVLKNGELLRETVQSMRDNHIDTVILPYLYDFDDNGMCTVRHLKTRIIRNDGCVTWVNAIHEDFRSNRELKQFLDEKIEVIHITSDKRAKESAERNLEIAKTEYTRHPTDPRNSYLMANAYLAQGKTDDALKYLKKFVANSQSAEEKYLVNLTLADITKEQSYIHKAWALRPSYPNAYFKMAEILFHEGSYAESKTFIELGLQMPKPNDSIIVFNPREYDYVPLTLLVNVCFELGEYSKALIIMGEIEKIYPNDKAIKERKEYIRKELGDVMRADEVIEEASKIEDKVLLKEYLDKLPAVLRAHPKVCFFRNNNFIKETSTGKDLVFYCSYTVKPWNPESVKKTGVGGSEESVINVAHQLSLKGWNVTVYNNCGAEGNYDGVEYKQWWSYNVKDKQDVTILWRNPKTAEFLDERAGRVFVDMHDVIDDGEFTKERMDKIEKVFVKTKAHRILFPSIPEEKIAIIPNGIDLEMFEAKVRRNPYLILTTSSADRHLESTLDIFEKLLRRQPNKPWKLAWYYGWGIYDSVHKADAKMMKWKETQVKRFEKLVRAGRAEGGVMLSHDKIAKKYLEAGVFIYPTQFYEVHCISALKAQAAGCRVICSDFAALNETVQYGTKIHTEGEKWGANNTFGDSESILEYVEEIESGKLVKGGKEYAKQFSWEAIANQWNENL